MRTVVVYANPGYNAVLGGDGSGTPWLGVQFVHGRAEFDADEHPGVLRYCIEQQPGYELEGLTPDETEEVERRRREAKLASEVPA